MSMYSRLRERAKVAAGPIAVLGLAVLVLYGTGIGCPIRYATGFSCPGCGMSRALYALLHLDFVGALRFHPLVYVLIPAALYFALGKYPLLGTKRRQDTLLYALLSLFIALYFFRLITGDPLLSHDVSQGAIYRATQHILPLLR